MWDLGKGHWFVGDVRYLLAQLALLSELLQFMKDNDITSLIHTKYNVSNSSLIIAFDKSKHLVMLGSKGVKVEGLNIGYLVGSNQKLRDTVETETEIKGIDVNLSNDRSALLLDWAVMLNRIIVVYY
ncbi:hypothetical protein KQX54_006278 [Cotesia glomerata]|uniref:Uncharacterized protein n=1 Tax=Cotesia glomerata TaxID=32391 RepID=A0AAV7HVQ7_COTGL|nr:hypothetical protein KQX54_006278 [Cotesia glomerata]